VTRLYVVSEGQTEVTFVRDVLAPHLEPRWPGRLSVLAPNLQGSRPYDEVKKLVRNLLGSPDSDVRVTTMIDLYGLSADFPGHAACAELQNAQKRVEQMERLLFEDISDPRLVPYLQLHEFEALILTDLSKLADYYPANKQALAKLAKRIEGQSPEEVNRTTPPSWRIRQAIPDYQKVLFGVRAVANIGLDSIRAKCRHFDSWLQRLEALL